MAWQRDMFLKGWQNLLTQSSVLELKESVFSEFT
jgi:hypothetical protein